MVERYLGVVEAVGSSPVTQTIIKTVLKRAVFCCFYEFFYLGELVSYRAKHGKFEKEEHVFLANKGGAFYSRSGFVRLGSLKHAYSLMEFVMKVSLRFGRAEKGSVR